MGITAEQGPLVTFGQAQQFDTNPDAGPNVFYQGSLLSDPRVPYSYQPGQGPSVGGLKGWMTSGAIPILDQVPSTASATNIASATPSSGTALTLVTSSGAGVTVGCSIVSAATGQTVTGLLGLDVNATRTATATFTNGSPKITWAANTMAGMQVGDVVTFTTSGGLPTGFATATNYYVVAIGYSNATNLEVMLSATPGGTPISAGSAGTGAQTAHLTIAATATNPPVVFGQGNGSGGSVGAWDPAWSLSRCVVVTSNADDTGGFYTISGYDIYNFPMTQKLTGVSSGTATTTKAFKYISSVVPSGTINSTTLEVGTVDVFGLPLRTDEQPYITVYWGAPPSALIAVASVTFVPADIQTAIATSGDVRGTVYGGSASDGSRKLLVFWNPQVANMNSTVGLVGQPQF
jgi:hypothetical protein